MILYQITVAITFIDNNTIERSFNVHLNEASLPELKEAAADLIMNFYSLNELLQLRYTIFAWNQIRSIDVLHVEKVPDNV